MGKRKKINKAIASFEKKIGEHKNKIKMFGLGKPELVSYWEKEIEEMQKQKKKKEEELEK